MSVARSTAPPDRHMPGLEEPGTSMPFEGFEAPESNFWRLPNNWFDLAARFTSWAEHKVVEYILRHTWGYHEYGITKLITMDEFMHGRKRRDGSRLDAGCGMAENSIKKGIADAVAHGFLIVQIDDSDRGRIKKYYAPRMRKPIEDEGEHATQPLPPPQTGGIQPTVTSAVRRRARSTARQQAEGQVLQVQGQELTLQDHGMTLTAQVRTLQGQERTPSKQSLIPSPAPADPRTNKTLPVKQQQQETNRQAAVVVGTGQPGEARSATQEVAHPLDEAHVRPMSPVRADLVSRLEAEGIAPAKAVALVQSHPAVRIERQLTWIDRRSYHDRAATLVAAIERDYSAPTTRRVPVVETNFDRGKFYRGSYALCPQCGSRPCLEGCRAAEAAGHARG